MDITRHYIEVPDRNILLPFIPIHYMYISDDGFTLYIVWENNLSEGLRIPCDSHEEAKKIYELIIQKYKDAELMTVN